MTSATEMPNCDECVKILFTIPNDNIATMINEAENKYVDIKWLNNDTVNNLTKNDTI